jgi:hypothetical protein
VYDSQAGPFVLIIQRTIQTNILLTACLRDLQRCVILINLPVEAIDESLSKTLEGCLNGLARRVIAALVAGAHQHYPSSQGT